MDKETKKLLIKIHCPYFGKIPLPDNYSKRCENCVFLDECLKELTKLIKEGRWKE